jgi:hypothetical protein
MPMSAPPVSFNVRLTLGDLYRLQSWYLLRGSLFFWIVPAIVILLFLNSLWWYPDYQEPLSTRASLLFGMIGFWIALFMILPRFVIRSRFKTQKSLQGEIQYVISEDGISATSASFASRLDWSCAFRAVETRQDFYVFVSSQTPFVLPKRFIPAQDITGVRLILQENVKGKNKFLR